jgi:Abnormal spindle-like microcephaly-assoc'd, ASPM-SPD-2-Hydin
MFRKHYYFAGLFGIICAVLLSTASAQTITPVLTQHNDNARTGQYLTETTLTPQNVKSSSFGKVFSFAVDGQIYAQPLYVPNVKIPSKGNHNVVYVVTENDSVYAFDADLKSTTPLWHSSLINPANGIVPVPCGTDGSTTEISCNVFPYYGITGTPVINLTAQSPAAGVMYFVARTAETVSGVTSYYQRLHAVDITTGAEESGSPVVIRGSVPGVGAGSTGGEVPFDPLADIQRVGLTLSNNWVYIAWAGAGHGWIFGYNTQNLAQAPVIFNTAPNTVLGGIWQTGNGLVTDSAGNIYVSIGDTLFDANSGGVDYGDTVLRLTPNPSTQSFTVADYFAPMDQICRKGNDLDLGSAGPMLLPTQPGSNPNELLVIGKSGNNITGATCDTTDVYMLNPSDLGQYETGSGGTDNVIQELTDAPGGFWSSPALWQGSSGTYIYMAGTNGWGGKGYNLDMYSMSNGLLSGTPIQSTNQFNVGATPSISASGATNGIVWAVERLDSLGEEPGDSQALLYAYDATNVATMLYSSSQTTSGRDQLGCGNKFQLPTIANGRVYVATQTELDVFGLLGTGSAPALVVSNPCNTFATTTIGQKSAAWVVSLKNIGAAALDITGVKITGTNAADFKLTNKCGTSIAPKASCKLSITFVPSIGLPETAFVTIKDNAAGSPHSIGLIGTGEAGTVVVNPSYLAFGLQDINIASAAQTVTVANSSNLPVAIDGVAISGTNPTLFTQTNNCPASLPVDGSCQINVTFTPTTTGQFSANLNITDNAAGSPQVVSLSGAGVQPNAVITSPKPPQISFGQVTVGTSSAPQAVSLLNNGGGTLYISSITFTGPSPSEFSQTNTCNGSVPSGSTCTINVVFTPTTQGVGQAYLNINDNSDPSPQQVSLSGSGS